VIHIDDDTIRRCRKGDQAAFTKAYRRMYAPLLSTAKRYFHDHEEAVFQMNCGFAKAMCQLDHYQQGAPFYSWVRRVLINVMIDHLRKKKRYREHLEFYESNIKQLRPAVVELNAGEEQLKFDDVIKLLDELPEGTRQVFNLFVIDGYKHHEIADLLKISEGTSKWHVARARKILIPLIERTDEVSRIESDTKNKVL
jgi:RNA polymerase sigma-70 factor (ECF subfamily)